MTSRPATDGLRQCLKALAETPPPPTAVAFMASMQAAAAEAGRKVRADFDALARAIAKGARR